MKKIFFTCCITGLCGTVATAQEGVVATGGGATGSGGTVSYSIGQINYLSAAGPDAKIIQGLQQPYEISEVIGTEEKGIELFTAVYPNPTSGELILRVSNETYSNLTYAVYDASGKELIKARTESTETVISLTKYANAQYFLKVMDGTKELKVYQIVKLY